MRGTFHLQLLCLLLSLWLGAGLTGCAQVRWQMLVDQDGTLALPGAPPRAKLVSRGAIQKFYPEGGGLSSFLFGKSEAGALQRPVSVAVGLDRRLAVADPGAGGVHLYLPVAHHYQLLAKADGESLQSPVSVAFTDRMDLYVVDSALRRIFVFNAKGEYQRQIRTFGRQSFSGHEQAFRRPTAIAISSGYIYIVDAGGHQVHVFDRQDRYLFSFGERGEGAGQFNLPTHLAIDGDGRLYVNDAMNFRIQVFNGEGEFLEQFGSHGDGSGDFAMSKGVAVDRWGIVYVVDSLFDAVQLFDQKRRFVMTLGGRGTEIGKFWLPAGLTIDGEDTLYVCDPYNHRIQLFALYDYSGDLQ